MLIWWAADVTCLPGPSQYTPPNVTSNTLDSEGKNRYIGLEPVTPEALLFDNLRYSSACPSAATHATHTLRYFLTLLRCSGTWNILMAASEANCSRVIGLQSYGPRAALAGGFLVDTVHCRLVPRQVAYCCMYVNIVTAI